MPDVDIDFFDRDGTLKLFKHAPASIIKDDKIEKHKTGVYFHAVPTHPVTGHSTLDYKKAEEYTLKSLKVPGFDDRKGVTLVNLGKIYLETNRFSEAKKILDSAMQNTLKYGTRKYQLEAYYRYHELDVKKGDYKNALNNYIEYKSIEDSLLNETKTRQIAEMGERYKTADKEKLFRVFTDTAAVTTDQLGTLEALTRVFSRGVQGGLGLEELNQIADRGVPVFRILEEQLGITRLEIAKFGQTTKGAKKILAALEVGLGTAFTGATQQKLDNLSTSSSNLGIAFRNTLDQIGEGGFRGGLTDLNNELSKTLVEQINL